MTAPSGMADRLAPYAPRAARTWSAHRRVDGALVLADLAGFTRLAERLARRGRVGAEDLTDAVNQVFARLIGVVDEFGGDILTFGGDALAVLFDGPGHVRHAAAAAAAMQREVAATGRLGSSDGPVLRMSAGVAAGPIDLHVVGTSHAQLVAIGATVTEACRLESAAGHGQVLVGRTVVPHLPAAWLRPAAGGRATLRIARVDPVPGPSPSIAFDAVPIAHLVPAGLRAELAEGIDPEHRIAALAFVRFAGTDALADDAPIVGAALGKIVDGACAACAAGGGTFLAVDLARDGGVIILAAGIPRARADDTAPLLVAARQIVAAGGPLAVSAGVHAGPVFAADVGAPQRRVFTVMGDTVNLTSRLMYRAGEGVTLATEAALGGSRTTFAIRPLAPFAVKGRREAVRAAAVGKPLASRAVRRGPLLGREPELAQLREAAAAVSRGGRVVEIVGEPGIGKSHLVDVLAAEVGHRRVDARCAPAQAVVPYGALAGALRSLAGLAPDLSPPAAGEELRARLGKRAPELLAWAPLLAGPFAAEITATAASDGIVAAFRQARSHDAVRDALRALIDAPALVVVEDLQWMDDAGLALLRHLAAAIDELPLLICATRRPAGPSITADAGDVIQLDPLGAEAIESIAIGAAGETALPDASLAAVRTRSGGNPLFAAELARQVAARGRADDLPATVEAVAALRIDELTRSDRALLRAAAVLGRTFSLELVAEITGDETAAVAVRYAPLAAPVEPGEPNVLRFVHDVYRDAAYSGLPYARRRLLHAAAARALRRRAAAGERALDAPISHHSFEAGDWEPAWRYARAAGDDAQTVAATLDAADLYDRALVAARRAGTVPDIDLAALAEALGDVCDLAGRYDRAAVAYAEAQLSAARAGRSPGGLMRKRGVLAEHIGRYSIALGWYTRARRSTDPEDRAALAELAVATAGIRFRQGRLRDCVAWARRAEDDAGQAGDERTLAHAWYLLDLALTDLGDPAALGYRGRSLPVFERLGDLGRQANVLNNLGVDAYYAGEWGEAVRLYRASRDAHARAGDVVNTAMQVNNEAEVLSDQGRLDEAAPLLRDVLRVWRAAGYEVGVAIATSNLGRLAARRGTFAEARRLLAEAVDRFDAIGAGGLALEARARAAECELLAGAPAVAAERARAALAAAAGQGHGAIRAQLERILGLALLATGDADAARGLLDDALATARAIGAPFEEALALDALVRLAGSEGRAAADDAAAAAAIRRRLGVIAAPDG